MKNKSFLLLSLLALISVCFSSCSKDDDDDNDKKEKYTGLVGGAWEKTEKVEMETYTICYYDVFKDDGTMTEYLVWFDTKGKFMSSEFKEYNWKVEDNYYCLKLKEESDFLNKIEFEVKDNKFYFFSAIDHSPEVVATRIDLTNIQEYIDKATPSI